MKKTFLSLFILILTISSFASILTPTSKKEVVKINKNTQIIIPENPSKEINLAAKGLTKYLNEIYGVSLNITTKPSGENYISIGDTNLFKSSNISKNNLKEDGYKLAKKDNNLFIVGYDNYGALNGTYCLLEEDLGCRWWDNHGNTTIPKQDKLEINFSPRSFNPTYPTLRHCFCSEIGPSNIDKEKHEDYIYGNKLKVWNWYYLCHSSFYFCHPDNFKDHPEWFAVEEGVRQPHQLCWSNQEVVAKIEKGMKDLLAKGVTRISLSPQDCYPLCECPNCRALDDKEGTKSATLVKALNQIITDMQKINPDLKIICLAYKDYVTPPKTIKPHKDLYIHLCSDSSDWPAPFATYDETKKYQSDIKAWKDFGTKIITWNYVVNYNHYMLPQPNYQVVDKNIKLLKKLNPNVNGIFLQGNYAPGEELSARDDGEMRAWIWSKLLWNPSLNANKLKKEFIYGYYGNVAKYIEDYEKLVDNIYLKNHKNMILNPNDDNKQNYGSNPLLPKGSIRFGCDVDLYSDSFVKQSKELLDKALKEANTSETVYRVNTLRKSILYLILGRSLGYFNEDGKYKSIEFDQSKKSYYLDILDELELILKHRNITTLAETQPLTDNTTKYLSRWREILTRDLSKFEIRPITTNWQFTKDENNSLNPIDNSFDTKDWVDMPCNIAWEDAIGSYDGFGWYKRVATFTKDDLKKKHIYMVFGGVDEEATVYVNGKLAIEHTCAKLGLTGDQLWTASFLIDLKPFIQEGDNQIKVKVFDKEMAGGIYTKVVYVLTDEDTTEATIISLLE